MDGKRTNQAEKSGRRRVIRVLKVVFTLAFGLAAFFLPAGTLAWPEAWIFIGFYLISVCLLIIWLKRHDPALLRERSERRKEGKSWDKLLLSLYSAFLVLMLITCGLDAVRFRWCPVPPAVKLIGFLGFVPVELLVFNVYKENTFASEVVRIQKDRNQHVIKTGPYRVVRHPMFSGIILLVICIPLALGSFFALIFSGLIIIVFVIRTYLEDATLQKELAGYAEYVKETRFRLIPGIW